VKGENRRRAQDRGKALAGKSTAAWPIMTVDFAAIRSAAGLSSDTKDSFWDALVVVATARSGADVLYTEDLNDGQEILGVRICNPFVGNAR
jgi:predicted nucleic acid-binding protein